MKSRESRAEPLRCSFAKIPDGAGDGRLGFRAQEQENMIRSW